LSEEIERCDKCGIRKDRHCEVYGYDYGLISRLTGNTKIECHTPYDHELEGIKLCENHYDVYLCKGCKQSFKWIKDSPEIGEFTPLSDKLCICNECECRGLVP
jgi:hypothetical protein